jgi:uncharacterized membrane protein YhaH (DUF805 family)
MSETMNPYAAPRAAVADVYDDEAGTQTVKWFSAKGRVGRLRYLARTFVGYLLLFAGIFGISLLAGLAGAGAAAGVIGFLAMIPYLIFLALLTIQRSHDMGWSGWTALLAFIPFVGLIWIFNPGTRGGNRFGAPAPPNTTMVKIGAMIFPLIMVIGFIAAITLPAYQDYVKRAKASQVVKP